MYIKTFQTTMQPGTRLVDQPWPNTIESETTWAVTLINRDNPRSVDPSREGSLVEAAVSPFLGRELVTTDGNTDRTVSWFREATSYEDRHALAAAIDARLGSIELTAIISKVVSEGEQPDERIFLAREGEKQRVLDVQVSEGQILHTDYPYDARSLARLISDLF